MNKTIILSLICSATLLSSCNIYNSYKRPKDLETKGLYRDTIAGNDTLATSNGENLGNLPWREVFKDPSLQKLIEKALKQNSELKSAALSVKQAQAALLSARLAYLPALSISPQGTVSSFDYHKASQTYNLPINASWQIDLFGQLLNPKRKAKVSYQQAQYMEQAVHTQLVANVANMYYTLLMLDKQLEISQQTCAILKKNAETMEAMMEAGMRTTSAGVAQSKAAYAQVKASLSDLENNIRKTENALCLILDEAPHSIERGKLNDQTMPTTFSAGIPLELLSNRPDVKIAESNLAASFYATNSARAAFYPQISLNAVGSWVNSAGGQIFNPGKVLASAIGTLTQPLFARGANIARLKQAKAQQEKAKLSFSTSLLKAGTEVSNALYQYQKNKEKALSREMQVRSAEKGAQDTKELFQLGSATYLEVLSAEQAFLAAQLSEASDKLEYLQTIVNLYQALGGGRE